VRRRSTPSSKPIASEGDLTKPRGTVGINSQFIRRDQLQKYAAWHITLSFYTKHCFYFGDTHVVNRGRDRKDRSARDDQGGEVGLEEVRWVTNGRTSGVV
jgi:hypothetical protein